ncbi:unnamed protein product [Acanthoscelides obtectus]|uniref:Cytochrome b5-related protein n=1 Tax=Acanthoscelides obtectus TaxID=200917 RepID=A0A9P0MD83_ACAOB|nr:unnamed protein product [Acanthoscelides obtectus]CAK1636018.1 Cytochrome b5-related protein [Acanthoscelides obtectus]
MNGLHIEHLTSIVQNEISSLKQLYQQKQYDKSLDKLSSLGIKYPKFRDHPLHNGHMWLESKRIDDGAEGLWRIHDQLYDFSDFVHDHPGGKDWLRLTKGTDITEAFESHHISAVPSTLLPQYLVRDAKVPRNSPFTFNENGFYNLLKRKIYEKLKTLPKTSSDRSKHITDFLLISYIGFAILAAYFRSFAIGGVAGIVLALTAIAAHNFFHQRDNFRMYYFDFTMMRHKEWRISHALSHHLYTNTVYDLEISALEPFLQYLPTEKSLIFRFASWIYSPIVYAFVYIAFYLKAIIQSLILGEKIPLSLLLPFTVLGAMIAFTNESVIFCTIMFFWIIITSSIYFGIVGVNAAHHHPDIFHDGDTPRPKDQMDWGIFQIDAVRDRKDINSSYFLVLTNFGDHTLHHLFPTIDHGYLQYLYPEFFETCQEFGIRYETTTQLELVKGQYRQLAKHKPNPFPPGHIQPT